MNSDETLHSQILEFYDDAVEGNYATRCIQFFKEKKRKFAWLFGTKDRIKLSISDEEAVEFFFTYNQDFQNLYYQTHEFLRKIDSLLSSQDIKMAIFKNKILYEKNQYKFSKFYNRFVKPPESSEFDFQDFYDKLKTAECILSIHPLDFLGASANSSFSSCLSIDSCHHTATTAYLRDDFTVIAYTTINGKKLGRQWIYFDGHYIIMGNIYGSISLPLQNKIRKLVEEKYANHLQAPNRWIISRDRELSDDQIDNCGNNNNSHDDYSVYFDLNVSMGIRHKERTSSFQGLYLEFEKGLDKFGDDTSSGRLELTYCSCCNESIEGDSTYTDDGEICNYCLGEHYTFCSDCEHYFYDSHPMHYIEDENYHICESCFENGEYGFCEMTESYYVNDNLIEVIQEDGSTMSVNRNYADEHYQICDSCGKYHEKLTQVDDDFICNKCLNDEYEFVDGSYVLKSEHAA